MLMVGRRQRSDMWWLSHGQTSTLSALIFSRWQQQHKIASAQHAIAGRWDDRMLNFVALALMLILMAVEDCL